MCSLTFCGFCYRINCSYSLQGPLLFPSTTLRDSTKKVRRKSNLHIIWLSYLILILTGNIHSFLFTQIIQMLNLLQQFSLLTSILIQPFNNFIKNPKWIWKTTRPSGQIQFTTCFVNKDFLGENSRSHLFLVVYGCFYAEITELSSWNRDSMYGPQSIKYLLSCPLQKMSADFW